MKIVCFLEDVSGSMREPYKRNYVNKDEIKAESILSFISQYANSNIYSDQINMIDCFACLFGTNPDNTYDLLSLIKYIVTNYDKIKESLDFTGYLNGLEKIRSVKSPVDIIEQCLNNEGANNIREYLFKIDNKYLKILGYYLPKNRGLCKKIVEKLPYMYRNSFTYVGRFSADVFYSEERKKREVMEHVNYSINLLRPIIENDLGIVKINWSDFTDYKKYSLKEVCELINFINDKFKKVDNEDQFLSLIEDHIYGGTPLKGTLTKMKDKILPIKDNYQHKLFVLITDGRSGDGSIKSVAEEIKRDLKADLLICFISSHDLSKPNTLFNKKPDNLDKAELELFGAASSVSSDLEVFKYMREEGYTVPEEGQIKLFFQANDKNSIETFIKLITKLYSSNDAILDLIGKVDLKKYVNKSIKDFKVTDQGDKGICFAHASATVIHLALTRIYNRNVPSFEEIKNELVNKYGEHGYNTEELLRNELPKYKLKHKEVDEAGARKAILEKRPCVVRYRWKQIDSYKFQTFFLLNKNQNQILTKEKLNEVNSIQPPKPDEYGGHAVVLIGCGNGYLKFLNSWGTDFGDGGFFKLENSKVLENMRFYDVYWDESDLSESEINAYKEHNNQLAVSYYKNLDKMRLLEEVEIICPLCNQKEKIKNFNGNLYEAICPKCGGKFEPTIENLLKKLYFDSIDH